MTETVELLRTPCAAETDGGPLHPDVAAERGQTLRLTGQILALTGDLLPTPVAQPSGNTPEDHLRKKPGRKQVTDLAIIVENGLLETGGELLPTPDAYAGQRGGSQHPEKKRSGGHQVLLADVLEKELPALLPAPTASEGHGNGEHGRGGRDLRTEISLLTPLVADWSRGDGHDEGHEIRAAFEEIIRHDRWGKYAPAIARWETLLGREAPAPTQLSAKGKAQLAPAFVEWMMGLTPGWVTDCDLSRVAKLKMLGNGVVPQQAYRALELMKGGW